MFNKKSAAITNTMGPLAELAAEATRLEEAGNWGDAAQVWQRIGSHKNASKKTRAEAKGRAAAARVRAEAKNANAAVASQVASAGEMAPPVDEAPSDALVEDAPTAPEAPADAPVDEVASTPPAPAEGAPTGDPGANDAPLVAPAPEESKAPKPRDARLPEVGAVIQKRDRKGELRSECKVIEGGIEYKGTIYKSLSAAALAASKDLGLGASTLDGWSWWGLKTRPAQPAAKKGKDIGEALERAFTKYRDRASTIVKDATGDDLIKVANTLKAQAAELVAMVAPTEPSAS
jgi:hypothetical protein